MEIVWKHFVKLQPEMHLKEQMRRNLKRRSGEDGGSEAKEPVSLLRAAFQVE